ncbi:hypothetical protein KO533_06470 [Shewanella sp. NKUCC05_KAH]|uniref:hypothetical protein n=1 Tax=Shewanella sp. NKUCC05_KAH TaxID=2842126 RepID=UPI001C5B1925|nr:hypothetical protein [Shewanella sp. NKUCC05_KAH]MBW3526204.1 hypothetical protein [Shewanella sp. NKUCC05_KAH]
MILAVTKSLYNSAALFLALSVIRYPLSVIRYPLSVIRYPLSVIQHQKMLFISQLVEFNLNP